MLTEPVAAVVAFVEKPSVIAPAPEVSEMLLLAVSAVVVLKLLLVDTVRLLKVCPPDERFNAPAVVLTTLAVPVVFRIRLGVERLGMLIEPEPVDKDTEVEPVSMPIPEMLPAPDVVRDRVEPLTLADKRMFPPVASIVIPVPEIVPPLTVIGLLLPLSVKETVPVAVKLLVSVMPPFALSVRL